MHFHCEVIIPPTDDVESSVALVMKQFDEDPKDDEEDYSKNGFWDWYVIGGRFAGNKLLASYDKKRLEEFHQWLQDEGVTVSGVQCGKQDLQPRSQIRKVDKKWNQMFPSAGNILVACPLFAHSNDQYGKDGRGTIEGDICPLKNAMDISCERVLFGGPSHNSSESENPWAGDLEPKFMLCRDQWNGCNHMKVDWDGTVRQALEKFSERADNYKEEYKAVISPQDDWLAVTVDYHS